MNRRVKWTAISLASTLAAYALYAVAAVPWIAPPRRVAAIQHGPARPAKVSSLAPLFPPGSWELDRPKILDTEQGMLLFDDYLPLEDQTKLRLTRCSLVRYVQSEGSQSKGATHLSRSSTNSSAKGRAVVLRAVSGADLTFDKPLNLSRGEFGNLVSGQLNGEVIIYSPATDLKSGDAFTMTTKDVQIDKKRIWTPHEVTFTYGLNSGSGRDWSIEFDPLDASSGRSQAEKDRGAIGQLRSFQLVHLDKLVLQLPSRDLFGKEQASSDSLPPAQMRSLTDTGERNGQSIPVEVTANGPCRIDFIEQVASLSDNVQIHRHFVDGPSDQLLCDLLQIEFSTGPHVTGNEEAISGGERGPDKEAVLSQPSMQLKRIIAVGYPVEVRVPSRSMEARAGRLEYDFVERRIWMEEKEKIELHDGCYRVEAKQLEYTMGEGKRLGRLWARGPGHIWGEREGRRFEVVWGDEVDLRPDGESQVLSIEGNAECLVVGDGRFMANEAHLFFWEVERPNAPGEFDLVPDRMKASGRVAIDFERFSARVREAALWFRAPDRNAPAGDAVARPFPLPRADTARTGKKDHSDFGRIDLVADVLHAQFVRSEPMQVERLNIQGGVHFQQTHEEGQEPLEIRGDSLELKDAHRPDSRGTLVGGPASVSFQGMQMIGPKFELKRGENLVVVNGPGGALLPQPARAGKQRSPAEVHWEGGMRFDGQSAQCFQDVSIRGSQYLENGDLVDMRGSSETLTIRLNQFVDFQRPKIRDDLTVREFQFGKNVEFDKNVWFESQMYDPQGQQKLFQHMEVPNLTINRETGEIAVQGAGWIRGVVPRTQFSLGEPGKGGPVKGWPKMDGTRPLDGATSARLNFVRVDFANRMNGQLDQRQLEFGDYVRAILAPVERWDETIDPHQEQTRNDATVILNCRRLSVAGMAGGNWADSLVLNAIGNSIVKGDQFSARGERISYSRAKDQLVLVGDGRNEAVLTYQRQPGAAPGELRGGKIYFWPSTWQFKADDVRSVDLHDLNQLQTAVRTSRN